MRNMKYLISYDVKYDCAIVRVTRGLHSSDQSIKGVGRCQSDDGVGVSVRRSGREILFVCKYRNTSFERS